jgi:hypothetical protein
MILELSGNTSKYITIQGTLHFQNYAECFLYFGRSVGVIEKLINIGYSYKNERILKEQE